MTMTQIHFDRSFRTFCSWEIFFFEGITMDHDQSWSIHVPSFFVRSKILGRPNSDESGPGHELWGTLSALVMNRRSWGLYTMWRLCVSNWRFARHDYSRGSWEFLPSAFLRTICLRWSLFEPNGPTLTSPRHLKTCESLNSLVEICWFRVDLAKVYHPYAWVLYVLGANLLWRLEPATLGIETEQRNSRSLVSTVFLKQPDPKDMETRKVFSKDSSSHVCLYLTCFSAWRSLFKRDPCPASGRVLIACLSTVLLLCAHATRGPWL